MNTQEELFEQQYGDFYTLLVEFITTVYEAGLGTQDTEYVINKIIEELSYIYSHSVQAEFDSILKELEVDNDSVKRGTVQGLSVVYEKENRDRLVNILKTHAENISSSMKEGLSLSDIIIYFLPDMVTLAMSEVHIAIERASVYAGKTLQRLTGIKIYKVWHSVNDELTCEICKALDGTVVGVVETFVKGDIDENVDLSGLDYTGGDITYAHPRCRCWVTYTTEKV